MKESFTVLNYLNEAKKIKEKYELIKLESETKCQMDLYILDEKYSESFQQWKAQRNIIARYLKERDEELVCDIKCKEKEIEEMKKMTGDTKREIERMEKALESAKKELEHIRAIKIIFLSKDEEMKKEKDEKLCLNADSKKINGKNMPNNQ